MAQARPGISRSCLGLAGGGVGGAAGVLSAERAQVTLAVASGQRQHHAGVQRTGGVADARELPTRHGSRHAHCGRF